VLLLSGYIHPRVPSGAERVDDEDVEPVRTGGSRHTRVKIRCCGLRVFLHTIDPDLHARE